MKRVKVELQKDHLERMAGGRKPVAAVAELVWNALDADATQVDVTTEENRIGGLASIRVVDNGHGIPYEDALAAFGSLGGSRKRPGQRSPSGRLLHGRAGEGRFSAFALGGRVTWKTRWAEGGATPSYEIHGTQTDLGTFEFSDPAPAAKRAIGTEVVISELEKSAGAVRSERSAQQLTETLALYLHEYPKVVVSYDGARLDPKSVEDLVRNYSVGPVTLGDGRQVTASLTVIEWRIQVERALILCDGGGFALTRKPAGIQAPGFHFTVYLRSDFFRELQEKSLLDLDELEPDLVKVTDAAKAVMREHFRLRAEENATKVVATWKEDNVYPYDGAPKSVLEEVERKVFDVVALNINTYLPDFAASDLKSKKFSLHMLKHSLEQSPQAVQKLVQEVLELPKEKQEELAELLERTTLTAIINASKLVGDRLDFLSGLEVLVFDPESKKKLLERSQLHRILAENTWIFGEEFNLTVDDQGLSEVLDKHLKLLGREAVDPEPVTTLEGTAGIVDLMLSRVVPQPRAEEREHLVIELKRPSQNVNADVATQIEKYAFAIAEDERFRDVTTRWTLWAVSNEVDEFVRKKTTGQSNRPDGILYQGEDRKITVWVKTWGQIINSCKARLRVFQERLDYMANRDSGLAHLNKTYAKYLPKNPGAGGAKGKPAPARETAAGPQADDAGSPSGS